MDEIYDDVTLPPLRVGENGEPLDWDDEEAGYGRTARER